MDPKERRKVLLGHIAQRDRKGIYEYAMGLSAKLCGRDPDWTVSALETCIDAEKRLTQYHSQLAKDAGECLRLADEVLDAPQDKMTALAEMMALVAQARWYVYMVKTVRGHFYTGISTDPERRITEHNKSGKGAKCLRGQRPVELVWRTTQPLTKSDALSLERQIKKLGHEQKQELIRNDLF